MDVLIGPKLLTVLLLSSFLRRLFLIGVVAAASLCFSSARAQWSLVQDGLLGPVSIESGASEYADGRLWLGNAKLYISDDLGLTWKQSALSLRRNHFVQDIYFLDRENGILSTNTSRVFVSSDGGMNWKELLPPSARTPSVCFLGDPKKILVAGGGGRTADYSADGGASWQSYDFREFVTYLRPLRGGGALSMVGAGDKRRAIFRTDDENKSWKQISVPTDIDCYTFAVDPCKQQYMFIVNEDGTLAAGNSAALYATTNGGQSWTTPLIYPPGKLCGSIEFLSNTLFLQTTAGGIIRSTDLGATWKDIGGPSAPYDTHLICAVDRNLLIAIDSNGSVWRTTNSGGFPLGADTNSDFILTRPEALFTGDTLHICQDPIVRKVDILSSFCFSPKILRIEIVGSDSADYQLLDSLKYLMGLDSLRVLFFADDTGQKAASIVITIEGGQQLVVPLAAYSLGKTPLFLATENRIIDTLGGEIWLPVKISGARLPEDFTINLHFDPEITALIDGYDIDNTPISLLKLGEGAYQMRFAQSIRKPDGTIATLHFQIFPTGEPQTFVTFDAPVITDLAMACEFKNAGDTVATITLPVGCGIKLISSLLRNKRLPTLLLTPNPAVDHVELISNAKIEGSEIEIKNLLGEVLLRTRVPMNRRISLQNLPSGSYRAEITQSGVSAQLRVVR